MLLRLVDFPSLLDASKTEHMSLGELWTPVKANRLAGWATKNICETSWLLVGCVLTPSRKDPACR